MELTRRDVLQASTAAGAVATPAIAGCVSAASAEGYAALYALADVADRTAGERLDVANPVPTGVHGHGWSPGGNLQTRVASAELFVYLDSPAWSWAQTYVSNFEDEDVDVHAVDALAGIDLLEWGGARTEGPDAADEHEDETHDGDAGHDSGDHDSDGHQTSSGNQDAGGHGHGHGEFDPHVWIDPVRAQTVVDTIADGLVHVDPAGEETYRSNAEVYRAELADLHEAFLAAVDDAERTTVVLAGHDSFQYLTERYGVTFETPTGVSPDQQTSQADLVEMIELVDAKGVDYVLYDAFEGDQYARTIVEDSTAEAALPLSPLTSTTEAWQREADGFVAQHRRVNLANLRRAMGAT